ncbi:AAA family ATPase [Streptomyces sp. NPDC008122]|uniref:AAA family ATPase n=1 Tax=Streptomyces sp. NPDC008122 TaxID=3364810 RepID=UPI0036ED3443
MPERRTVTSAEVRARLRARRTEDEHAPAPPRPEGAGSSAVYREAAALLGFFDAADLVGLDEPPGDQTLRDFVVRDCERVSTPVGTRWCLAPRVRSATLETLRGRDELLGTLAATRPQAADTGRAMAEAYLRGSARGVEAQTMDQLSGTLRFVTWLAAAPRTAATLTKQGVRLPDVDAVRRAIEVTAILQPLRLLADDHFVGRRAELGLLSEYVENRRLFPSLAACQPVAVYGLGGVGKSALVSRLLLDHVWTAGRQNLPLCYLTFDRADLLPRLPLTLLAEAAHQLSLLSPEAADGARGLEKAVHGTLLNARGVIDEGNAGALPDYLRDDEDELIRRFGLVADAASGHLPVPLIMVLDTMERAQRHGPDAMARLWDFLDRLQRAHPLLRLVFAGRSPLGPPSRTLALPGLEPALAVEFLRHQLGAAGIRVDKEFLRSVTGRIGENPLSLRLAAEVIRREGQEGLRDDEDLHRILSTLEDEEVQAVLYRRVLDHLDDPDLKRIASPGLTLRRITPDLIRKVLAVPCELGEVDDARARHLFRLLEEEGTLMDPVPGQEALVHRADVRRTTLPLLHRDSPEGTRDIHRRAVDYYAATDGVEARAEELYHRLALGQDTGTLDARWTPEAGVLLDGALDELPASSRVYLADRLRFAVDRDALGSADSPVWARQTVRRGRDLLDAGKPAEALSLLRGRPEEGGRAEIAVLEIEALAMLGRTDEAREREALARGQALRTGDASGFVEIALLGARIAEDLAQFAEALGILDLARRAARALPDPVPLLRVDVARLRAYRRAGAGRSPEATALRMAVLEAADKLGRRERVFHPTLVRDLAAEVGEEMPELVSDTARLLGVEVEGRAGTALGEALTEDDVQDFTSVAVGPEATLPTGWDTFTSGERGDEIAAYLDTAPEHGDEWVSALVKSYRIKADTPTFEPLRAEDVEPSSEGDPP